MTDWGTSSHEREHLPSWTITQSTNLAQVCRRWRSIAESCSVIWSDLYLDVGAVTVLTRAQAHLQLSRSQPLHIVVAFREGPLDPENEEIPLPEDFTVAKELFALLITHADRWRLLSLSIQTHAQRHLLRNTLETVAVPQLKIFRFVSESYEDDTEDVAQEWVDGRKPVFVGGAPVLETFVISGCHWYQACPPLGALTYFRYSRGDVTSITELHDFTKLFKDAPLLEHVVLIGEQLEMEETPVARIHAPNLQRLDLFGDPVMLASCLDAPLLSELELDTNLDAHFESFINFVDTTPNSTFPRLTTLSLTPNHWTLPRGPPRSLRVLVDRFPYIEHLHVDTGDSSSNGSIGSVPMLQIAQHGWPHLKSLTTEGLHKADLLEFAHARQGSPFAEFRFTPAFVKALRLDYPDVIAYLGTLGIKVRIGECYWELGHENGTNTFLASWEDGTTQSIFGSS